MFWSNSPRRRRHCPVHLLAAVLVATPVFARQSTWLRLDSPHFVVWSDASESTARDLLSDLEAFRAQVLVFTGLKPQVAQHVSVICFDSDREFAPYKPRFNGKTVTTVAGLFNGSNIEAQIALTPREGRGVVYHEYVHALYRELGWDTPLWFNEGSAELFSTFATRKGVAYFGNAIPEHVSLLRHVRMPLSDVFGITTDSPDYNGGLPQGVFYAESWAFVHFLACNPDPAWRTRINAFLSLLSAGRPPDNDTCRQAFGVGLAELEDKLRRHVQGGEYSVQKQTFDRGSIEREIHVRPATDDEVALELTILDLTVNHSGEAKFRLLDIPPGDPRAVRAQEALAIEAFHDGDESTARERLVRAVELGTKNIQTHWVLAQGLTHDYLTGGTAPTKRIGSALADQLRFSLQAVLAANPDAVEAWDELARAEAFSPEPDPKAVERIEAALARWPEHVQVPQIRVLLAFTHHRLGHEVLARQMAADVMASPATAESTRRLARNLLRDLLPHSASVSATP